METYKVIFKEGETTGVYGISLVENPAMESMFIALKEDTKLQLKAIDTEKRILLGAVLIPEKPVYRNQNGKEFNIVFPAETILLASQNFLKQSYQSSSTLEHNEDMKLSDVTFVESWIKEDMVNDKSVLHGFDEPIGTWFASMKVDNEQVWNDYIKTGKVTGFSIDGFFDLEQINLNKQEMNVNEIVNAITEGFLSLTKAQVQLGSIANQDGSITFNFEGDTIAVGTLMSMTGADGELPVPDGDYTLADGMMVKVVGSTVSEIGSPEAAVEEENAPAPMAAAPQGNPVVKSEKSTQEVFYQLSKEDFNAMTLEFASQLENKISELRSEFKADLEKQTPVSLTKAKPASEKTFEQMTALEKFRALKN